MAKNSNQRPTDNRGRFVRVNGGAGIPTVSDASSDANEPGKPEVNDATNAPESIAGFESFDPTTGTTERGDSSSGTGKRRGRPPGTKNRVPLGGTSKAEKESNISGLEGVLVTIHLAAAKMLDTPELQLTEAEAHSLAGAVQKVNEQYQTMLNPRALAWLQLAMVAGSIYGTRIYAVRARYLAQGAGGSAPRPAPGPAKNVIDIKSTPKPGPAPMEARTPADLYGLDYSAAIAHEM
jgi:hypothetical protein